MNIKYKDVLNTVRKMLSPHSAKIIKKYINLFYDRDSEQTLRGWGYDDG